ncbi:MAG: hypothetical protein ABFD15_06040 [Methanofastidiosum sp.]
MNPKLKDVILLSLVFIIASVITGCVLEESFRFFHAMFTKEMIIWDKSPHGYVMDSTGTNRNVYLGISTKNNKVVWKLEEVYKEKEMVAWDNKPHGSIIDSTGTNRYIYFGVTINNDNKVIWKLGEVK